MRPYLISLGAGLLVGVLYSLLNVRSPAPPLVALVGLLGILVGEQIIPVGKHRLAGAPLFGGWREVRSAAHLFGSAPARHPQSARATEGAPTGARHAGEKGPPMPVQFLIA